MVKLKIAVYGLAFLITGSGLLHAADLADGFLGLKWGTNISALPEFKKLSGTDDVGYYQNPTKIYTVFEVENPAVIYGFYKDQFFATYIQVDTIRVFNRVKDHISEKFGTPKTILKMKIRQTIYRWKHKDIKIKLKLFETEGKMKLAFYYRPLSNQLNKAQRGTIPETPTPIIVPDDKLKQDARNSRRLNEALDVMGF
jgi:uncharacterized protein YcgL (UPF0745 family)